MIIGLPSTLVGFYWHQLAPLISKAIKRIKAEDLYSLQDYKHNLLETKWQCWVYVPEQDKISCVFITHIVIYPAGRKALQLMLAGGTGLKQWESELWDTLLEFAEKMECDEITFQGRPGWIKTMQRCESTRLKTMSQYVVKL